MEPLRGGTDLEGPLDEFDAAGDESLPDQSCRVRGQELGRLLVRGDERGVPGFDLRPGLGAVLRQVEVRPAPLTG